MTKTEKDVVIGIHSDPDIMGGTDVFIGTRIPAYMIGRMALDGETEENLLGAYPSLTKDHIKYAIQHVKDHPGKEYNEQRYKRDEKYLIANRKIPFEEIQKKN